MGRKGCCNLFSNRGQSHETETEDKTERNEGVRENPSDPTPKKNVVVSKFATFDPSLVCTAKCAGRQIYEMVSKTVFAQGSDTMLSLCAVVHFPFFLFRILF
mmetsp:Transcript_23810/g.47332  ORF Transcript_23810/g.47332 Transcript_23810/m.47332 type:complete len:102 (+) Transcript_23810:138-443(+)